MIPLPPTFSIVVPAYNAEGTLREALGSVLAQTFTSWEAIVVDDGSTDGTAAIADEFAARDRRISVLHQPNRGRSVARNAGMGSASGEFLCLLDADDVYLPAFLEAQRRFIAVHPDFDVYSCNVDSLWPDGSRSPYALGPGYDDIVETRLDDLLEKSCFTVLAVFRRSLFECIGGFSPHLHRLEDYELWVRASASGSRLLHNPATLALYRQRPGMGVDEQRMGLSAQRDVLLDLVKSARLEPHSRARALDSITRIETTLAEMDAPAARDRLEAQIDSGRLHGARRLLWAARSTYPVKWKLAPALAVMIVSPWLFARLAGAWRHGLAAARGDVRDSGQSGTVARPRAVLEVSAVGQSAPPGYRAGMVLRRLRSELEARGVSGVARMAFRRVRPRPRARALRCYRTCRPVFRGGIGLEIGGPSDVFRRGGVFPVYAVATRIDNCNYDRRTVWEGAIEEGATFHYDDRHTPGNQYIAEATDLGRVATASYDFVLSSHTLEHTANPLQALAEWMRVLKDKGVLVLVVPGKDATFDHRRPVTSIEHLVRDLEEQVSEGDLTHLEEILELHDLSMDPAAGDSEAFRRRSEKNLENRCLHHHVFDSGLAMEALRHAGLQVQAVDTSPPFNILVVAQKLSGGERGAAGVSGARTGTLGRPAPSPAPTSVAQRSPGSVGGARS